MNKCDRCQMQASIECSECSMMIYSQNGDQLQSMKLCEECDGLLHQISYKANHKRHKIGENVRTETENLKNEEKEEQTEVVTDMPKPMDVPYESKESQVVAQEYGL